MRTKFVTKNDLLILTLIILISLSTWLFVDSSERSKSPFSGCNTSELMIEISSDRKVAFIETRHAINITTPVLHKYYNGAGVCETVTYLFKLNNKMIGLSNLGCHAINTYPEGAKGVVYTGSWLNSDPSSFDWTDNAVVLPKDREVCF